MMCNWICAACGSTFVFSSLPLFARTQQSGEFLLTLRLCLFEKLVDGIKLFVLIYYGLFYCMISPLFKLMDGIGWDTSICTNLCAFR